MTQQTQPKDAPMIYGKMADVLAAISHVGKDSKNEHFNFRFRGIDAVMNALHPILAEHRVFYTPEVLEARESFPDGAKKHNINLRVRYTFYAEDGSSVATVVEGEGIDNADKATSKSLSAALKYALLQTFCVPTEDIEDADASGARRDDASARKTTAAASRQQTPPAQTTEAAAPAASDDVGHLAPKAKDKQTRARVAKYAKLQAEGKKLATNANVEVLMGLADEISWDVTHFAKKFLNVPSPAKLKDDVVVAMIDDINAADKTKAAEK